MYVHNEFRLMSGQLLNVRNSSLFEQKICLFDIPAFRCGMGIKIDDNHEPTLFVLQPREWALFIWLVNNELLYQPRFNGVLIYPNPCRREKQYTGKHECQRSLHERWSWLVGLNLRRDCWNLTLLW